MSRDLVRLYCSKQLCLQPLQICKIRCRNNSAKSRDKDFINLHRVSFLRFADTHTKLKLPSLHFEGGVYCFEQAEEVKFYYDA